MTNEQTTIDEPADEEPAQPAPSDDTAGATNGDAGDADAEAGVESKVADPRADQGA